MGWKNAPVRSRGCSSAGLDADVAGAWMVSVAVALAARRRRRQRAGQGLGPARGQIAVAREIADEEIAVHAGVEVVHARSEGVLSQMARAGVHVARVQIVDGGKVIFLCLGAVGGDRMAHLHGGVAVEVRGVGHHSPEHRDIHRAVGALEQ